MKNQAIHLSQLLESAAQRAPDQAAVEDEAGRSLSFAELARQADRLAARLGHWGVGRGDRVGLFLPKSLEAVASIHGILRSGAAYVPIDPTSPAIRGAGIFADAQLGAIVVHATLAEGLVQAWPESAPLPHLIIVGEGNEGQAVPEGHAWEAIQADETTPGPAIPSGEADDLAYILYTSGSTGKPKGVMLSHANAFCFIGWCEESLGLREGDRFSSHAPFHFDLSVFDLYASCRFNGTLVLIGEALSKDPARLGPFVSERRIDVWYSAPSILALMTEHGKLDAEGYRVPRLVLFAGEVFPIKHLKQLRKLWSGPDFWNLYGPTETNVCTALKIPSTIPDDREQPYSIGFVCPPLKARVVDEQGLDVPPGSQGELVIAGPGVMRGYFGRPDLDAEAFFQGSDGTPWYRTGDLVADAGPEGFDFHGRRDRMVKKRGYRIELGEIESALYRHEDVASAAVIARDDESGVSIDAFVAVKPERKASIIAMKRHCTTYLPHYMIPDRIKFLNALPTTSTDKVDYQGLKSLMERESPGR